MNTFKMFGFVALQLYDPGYAPRPSGNLLQSAIELRSMVEKGRADVCFFCEANAAQIATHAVPTPCLFSTEFFF